MKSENFKVFGIGLLIFVILPFQIISQTHLDDGQSAKPNNTQMSYLDTDNARLYYEEYGEGSPLILLAGLASDSQSWMPVLEQLAQNHRVIILDNRGCGRTKCDPSQISLDGMIKDIIALLDHLEIAKVNVLGHSMGGMLAIQLAAQHPERMGKLILAASTPRLSLRSKTLLSDWEKYWSEGMETKLWFRNMFYWIFTPQFFEDTSILKQSIQFAINYPYPQSLTQFSKQVNILRYFDGTQLIKKIQSPTLILCGEKDILIPSHESLKAFEPLPNAQFEIIPEAAHSLFMEQSDTCTQKILDFLK